MESQVQHWNELHTAGRLDDFTARPSSFALEIGSLLPRRAKILELGTGFGSDAICFNQAGHEVVATDFSPVAVHKARERAADIPDLEFALLDISAPFPYHDGEFDVVYARLSLHYFPDMVTRKIIREIHRVLAAEGLLCFLCKTTDDAIYGQGNQIEPDMFEFQGHIRHFFSEEYARSCLDGLFKVLQIENGHEQFYEQQSAYVKVVAKAIKNG